MIIFLDSIITISTRLDNKIQILYLQYSHGKMINYEQGVNAGAWQTANRSQSVRISKQGQTYNLGSSDTAPHPVSFVFLP